MNQNLIAVCYESDAGLSDIRTLDINGILYVSLKDVTATLNKENKSINQTHISKSMTGIIQGLLKDLDYDEYINYPISGTTSETEMFLTQPGLFRVLSNDKSQAGKKFQRWLYHDVVPSITKYGTYPAPENKNQIQIAEKSHVKQLVVALLEEIEEREMLEKRIQVQINSHGEQLSQLADKLDSISDDENENNFQTVKEYIYSNDIDPLHEQLMQGWCIKLCAENGRPTNKSKSESAPAFEIDVLKEAYENCLMNIRNK